MATKKVSARDSYRVLRDIYNQPKFVGVLLELDTNPKARCREEGRARISD